jgi:hypothetical protein
MEEAIARKPTSTTGFRAVFHIELACPAQTQVNAFIDNIVSLLIFMWNENREPLN